MRIGDWESREKTHSLYDPIIIGEKRSVYHGNPDGKLPVAVAFEDVPRIAQASKNQSPTIITRPKYKSRVGFMPGDAKGGLVTGSLERLIKYFRDTFKEEYAPIKDPGKNLKGWIYNGFMSWMWDGVESVVRPINEVLGDTAQGFQESYHYLSRNFALDFSPFLRTTVVSYAPGKSYINQIWVYKKHYAGDDYKVPIFFNTFESPVVPNEAELNDKIDKVDAELKSAYDKMGTSESASFLNGDFIRYSADKYTGNCWKDYFEHEPTSAQRWFVKDDTKGSNMWYRDTIAEASLPPALVGTVEIYKKDVHKSGVLYNIGKYFYGDVDIPKSGKMAWSNIKGDFSQDMSYVFLGGLVVAALLERLGVEAEGIRRRMEVFYKLGSKIQEGLGVDRWLTYEIPR